MSVRAVALVLLGLGCHESPFGTRTPDPGQALLGRLQPEVEGRPACLAWPSPSKQLTGLGNGRHFYIANQANATLLAFDQPAPGQPWVESGSPLSLPSKPNDVATNAAGCPYVAEQDRVAPHRFESGECPDDAPSYPVGPALITFDSAGTLYAARADTAILYSTPVSGGGQAVELPVTPARLTVHAGDIWVAHQHDDGWQILVLDPGTLKQRGHIDFPWPAGEDLAGMVWDDASGNLVAHSNDRDPLICSYVLAAADGG
jgi:hypothetical protein